MTTHTLTGDKTTAWKINQKHDTWILAQDTNLTVSYNTAIYETAGGGNDDIRILGTLENFGGSAYGIHLLSDDNSILFGNNSQVYSTAAVYAPGSGNSIVNMGDIDATYVTLYSGLQTSVKNSGDISGNTAIELAFGGSHIVNEASGHITGTDGGIYLLGSGNHATIVNKGLIDSHNLAIDDGSSGGSLKVINTGMIDGAVTLGDGNDFFDSHNGTFASSVSGGDGNDTYILGKGQHVLENVGEGLDSVKSFASATLDANVDFLYLMGKGNLNGHGNDLDNLIYGNTGNNHLSGGIGADVLGGKSGNDVLSGNAGNDTFVFDKAYAVDTIGDYTDGQDTIQIGGFNAIGDFAELQPHMSQHGNDVWIAFGHGDKLVVAHTALGVLDSSDFSF